jgi:hypothetical protein
MRCRPDLRPGAQGAQCIEDDGNVDDLLRQSTGNRRQETDRGKGHRQRGHSHSRDDALHRDGLSTLSNGHRIRYAVEPVDQDHDVSGF